MAPGNTVEDVVTARVDYERLDRPGSAVRLRLNSTVVRATNLAESGVQVVYLRGGVPCAVRARRCVLACWNVMIPYLCPELPAAQQAALHSLVKAPLVYANVALRDWRAFRTLGVSEIYAPGAYFSNLYLNPIVDIGAYRTASDPARADALAPGAHPVSSGAERVRAEPRRPRAIASDVVCRV